jgi:hypothetical protein
MKFTSNDAILAAEEYMKLRNCGFGPCIAVVCKSTNEKQVWELEFAYEGMQTRSDTADPPCILLKVDMTGSSVSAVELM